jgi:hypothetical protein
LSNQSAQNDFVEHALLDLREDDRAHEDLPSRIDTLEQRLKQLKARHQQSEVRRRTVESRRERREENFRPRAAGRCRRTPSRAALPALQVENLRIPTRLT